MRIVGITDCYAAGAADRPERNRRRPARIEMRLDFRGDADRRIEDLDRGLDRREREVEGKIDHRRWTSRRPSAKTPRRGHRKALLPGEATLQRPLGQAANARISRKRTSVC
jgi:hypothetical protein